MTTTSRRPAFSFPRAPVEDENGYFNRPHAVQIERMLSALQSLKDAAVDYDTLDESTATTAEIAAALNTFMDVIKEI